MEPDANCTMKYIWHVLLRPYHRILLVRAILYYMERLTAIARVSMNFNILLFYDILPVSLILRSSMHEDDWMLGVLLFVSVQILVGARPPFRSIMY